MIRIYNEPVCVYIRVSFGSICAGYSLKNYIERTGKRGETVLKQYGNIAFDEDMLRGCNNPDDFIGLFSQHCLLWREDENGCKVDDLIERIFDGTECEFEEKEDMHHFFASYQKAKVCQEIFLRRIGIYRKYYSAQEVTVDILQYDDEEKMNQCHETFQHSLLPVQLEMPLGV